MASNNCRILLIACIFFRSHLLVLAAGFDLTCFSSQPLLLPSDSANNIGGYPAGDAAGATIKFSRAVDTRNGNGLDLPTGSSLENHPKNDDVKLLVMETTGGKERLGVFNCEASKNGVTYKIPTIILHKEGNPTSEQRTVTANVGDNVDLEVSTGTTADFYWQKDGGDQRLNLKNHHLIFTSVELSDEGLYECHISGNRENGKQAMIRLIVRECKANSWDPPSCDQRCPICYNGGICDDETGVCICAPGFSGTNCETVHGLNTFGQDGSFECSSTNPDGCRGKLFCQLDPYGCSCAAGYQGQDCNADCSSATFGADCNQTCHCPSGDTCDGATGVCSSGGCEAGWRGDNCQVCDAIVATVKIAAQSSTSLSISWTSSNPPDSYKVDYQLTNEDNCKNLLGTRTNAYQGTQTSTIINRLIPHSTYTVIVKAIDGRCEGNEISKSENTGFTSPTVSPSNVGFTATTQSLTFTWDVIPCGSRGGTITYDYIFNSTPTKTTASTTVTINQLTACSSYDFKVKGSNEAGGGPWSLTVSAKTSDETPGGVTSLAVDEVPSESGHLDVTWNAPHPPCAVDYAIRYKATNIDQCDTSSHPKEYVDTTTNAFIFITGLQPYSTYQVFVSARNPEGTTEMSQPGTTGSEAPTAPPANISYTATTNSLAFSWHEIPCGSRGGDITYKYVFDSSVVTPEPSRSLTINQLSACSSFNFQVKGTNAAGDGPWSQVTSAKTSDQKPGAVTALTVQDVSSKPTQLRVTWKAPQPPCAVNYLVEYKATNIDQCDTSGGPKNTFNTITGTSVTITGLQAYSTYNVFVSANNDLGLTENIQSGNSGTTAPAAPPSSVTSIGNTNTSLTFEWDRVPCGYRGGPNEFRYELTAEDVTIDEGETADLQLEINDLIPCKEYTFSVKAFNDAGPGEVSDPIKLETDIGVLGPVKSLVSTETTSNSVILTWNVQVKSLCSTDKYYIEYALLNRDQCEDITNVTLVPNGYVDQTNVTIQGLEPHSTYEVFVYPVNKVGFGAGTLVVLETEESEPSGPPTEIEAFPDKDAISFTWDEPNCGDRNGIIAKYKYTLTPGDLQGTIYSNNVTIEGLNPCTKYELRMFAVTGPGEGPEGRSTETTENDVPLAPIGLALFSKNQHAITIGWDEPDPAYCRITSYTVSIREVFRPYDDEFIPPNDATIYTTLERDFAFNNLSSSTEYEVKVYAHTETGMGEFVSQNFSTSPASEEELGAQPNKPRQLGINATALILEIPQLTGLESQYLTEFKIFVEPPSSTFFIQSPDLNISYEAGYIPKSEVQNQSMQFVVGSGHTQQNPPLDKELNYKIYLGSCSVIGTIWNCNWAKPIKFGSDGPINPASYIVPVLVVLIAVAAVGFVFIRRRRVAIKHTEAVDLSAQPVKPSTSANVYHNTSFEKDSTSKASSPRKPPGPVQISSLAEYIRNKRSGDDYSFREDYSILPQELLHSYDAAKDVGNRLKNRYANIATYDHSRVLLSIQGTDRNSDYINASYIDGYQQDNQYIASQGPNEASVPDFWRMIWEHKLTKIVMLTNLVEQNKLKCEQYWPDQVEKHGPITVTLSEEEVMPNYTIRTFAVINDAVEGQHLNVCQFHYTAWPDMDVPKDVGAVLKFMDLVEAYNKEDTEPTVVHCSAGVGRTGAYISIQSLKKQAQAENQVDVFKFITDMRHKRMKMIQTSKQYEFIFDALLQHCVFEDTSIPVSSFREMYTKLKGTGGSKKRKSALDVQFQLLQDITIIPKRDRCRGGTSEENINKNRFKDIIPADNERPYLMSGGEGTSNYINATFVDNGNKTTDAYVTTQMPMPNTVDDIWRMAVDYKCSTFIMLNQMDSNDQTMAQYWPNKGQAAEYGPITIECKSEKETDQDITTRIFQLRYKQNENTVVQFCLNNWSNDSNQLPDPRSVMTLALKVVDRMSRMSEDKVLVHCIDGMGISGTFCAIVSALEGIATEQTVDVFQTARKVRMCNPRAIQTKEQYRFIYDVIQNNLDSNQVYENFVPT